MLTEEMNGYEIESWLYEGKITPRATLNPSVLRSQVSWKKEVRIQSIETELVRLTSRVMKIEENLEKGVPGSSVQIYDLENPKYSLNMPISLILTKEGSMFYAEAVDFDLFGVGDDEKSAIKDLKDVLVVYHEGLTFSKKDLGKRLQAKLRLLLKVISTK